MDGERRTQLSDNQTVNLLLKFILVRKEGKEKSLLIKIKRVSPIITNFPVNFHVEGEKKKMKHTKKNPTFSDNMIPRQFVDR